jgi:DNA-binding MarR family transcriptional regulator
MKHLGNCDVKAVFTNGIKELSVTTYAATILITCFNSDTNDEITFTEIQEITKIPQSDLVRNLLSLSLGKHRILRKSSKGKNIEPQDSFTINQDFKSSFTKIKILSISAKDEKSPNENEEGKVNILADRRCLIEAALVRIMKAEKKMEHANLVSSVLQQLAIRFVPDPTMIKERIERLIEQDYLERDTNSRNIYHYLA